MVVGGWRANVRVMGEGGGGIRFVPFFATETRTGCGAEVSSCAPPRHRWDSETTCLDSSRYSSCKLKQAQNVTTTETIGEMSFGPDTTRVNTTLNCQLSLVEFHMVSELRHSIESIVCDFSLS